MPLSHVHKHAQSHVSIKKRKCVPLPHPGRVPRAQQIKKKAKNVKMNGTRCRPSVGSHGFSPRGGCVGPAAALSSWAEMLSGTWGPGHCSTKGGHHRTAPLSWWRHCSVCPLSPPGWERWAALAASPWVLRTISRGYRLQFAVVPPRFAGIIHSQAQGESARVLQEEILSLFKKRSNMCRTSRTVSERL